MPTFFHLTYYNLQYSPYNTPQSIDRSLSFMKDNIKLFAPFLNRFRKLRRRNCYSLDIDKPVLTGLIKLIEDYRFRKSDYKLRRRHFKTIRNRLFKVLIKKQSFCSNCLTIERLSLDHIIPLIKGGTNHISNFQILCISCNSKKGGKIQL